ncbi:RNA polymerase sigma factor [Chitinophaga nivalis]|uniref:RNA polymerase sigma-70 factor n=1 Tax=Chitinophaga nivalis TaxID=2991709 RepID=A0ABT3IRM9_9BACT|nr:RNA polymerase sigma-70 factor [Chitinophaga nivalis]MCW3463677.1 RNA polymerase sigma-70 factor [Chitinophaga nivalis]MCW3486633.1 RNA polymerase sigma-70 factor [Chitinophaga nivalis]
MNIPGEHNEAALLALAADGDEAAFTELFMRYHQKLYGFMLRLNGSPDTAEDTVQDVFLKLWKERDKLSGIHHFSSYLFRMAQNHAINAFRKMARATLLPVDETLHPPVAPAALEQVEFKALRERVQEIVTALPPQQQQVYLLNREKGLKHEEIARLLQISPSTVNKHLVQALRTIRTRLGDHTDLLPVFYLLLLYTGSYSS